MDSLEAELHRGVAAIVKSTKDLRAHVDAANGDVRREIHGLSEEIRIERGLTKDLVAAVDRRMDEYDGKLDKVDKKLDRVLEALAKLKGAGL